MDTRRGWSDPVRAAVLPLAVGALLAAAACSSTGGGGSSAASGPAGAPGGAPGTTVTVSETEFSLTLSQNSFTPGRYTFVARDAGKVSHALAISGPGLAETRTGVLGPGGTAQLTVTLKPGSYELWCPVDGHKALGMDARIQVGAGPQPTSPAGSPGTGSSPGSGGGYGY